MLKRLLNRVTDKVLIVFLSLFIFCFFYAFSYEKLSKKDYTYYKMISYYLVGENDTAKEYFSEFKNFITDKRVVSGYEYLLSGDKYSASNTFYPITTSRERSLYSIIGYSLSIGDYSPYNEEYFIELAYDLYRRRSIVYAVYGWFYLKEGDLLSANELIRKAIRINPLPEYYILLSKVFRIREIESKELESLEIALKKGVKSKIAVRRIIELYFKKKEYKKVINTLDEYGHFLSKTTFYALKLKAMRFLGDLEGGRSFLKSIEDENWEVLMEKGIFEFLEGDYKKAYRTFKKVEKDITLNKEGAYYYGLSLYKLKKSEYSRWLLRAYILGIKDLSKFPKDFQLSDGVFSILGSVIRQKIMVFKGAHWIDDDSFLLWGRLKGGGKNFIYLFKNGRLKKKILFDKIILDVSSFKDLVAVVSKEKRKELSTVVVLKLPELKILANLRIQPLNWRVQFSKNGDGVYVYDLSYEKAIYESPFSYSESLTEEINLYEKFSLKGFVFYRKGRGFRRVEERDIRNFKILSDYEAIFSFKEKFEKLKELIKETARAGFLSDKKLKFSLKEKSLFALFSTKENIFELFKFFDEGTFYYRAKKSVKPDLYELLEIASENFVLLSGTNNLVLVDVKKGKAWRLSKELVKIKKGKNIVAYIESKKQRPYVFDYHRFKAKRVSNKKKFTDILITKLNTLFFVRDEMELFKFNGKELVYSAPFFRSFYFKLSPDGEKMLFYNDGNLVVFKVF